MEEKNLIILLAIFIFCAWFINGIPANLEKSAAASISQTYRNQNVPSSYSPQVYSQTIILR
jgi:hypothetical protein